MNLPSCHSERVTEFSTAAALPYHDIVYAAAVTTTTTTTTTIRNDYCWWFHIKELTQIYAATVSSVSFHEINHHIALKFDFVVDVIKYVLR
mmetsp:Transcript_15181/g.21962  ORF Transcript_15181/g.21962 Transcript_15181/m.21962 type:complete len:91 (+) Transcript_15181:1026-1298(+)